MLRFEQDTWAKGCDRVAGVDEAGRGPLAGPVIAAAVVFEPGFLKEQQDGLLLGLNDSKQITESRRDHFFQVLSDSSSVEIGIGSADPEEIDEINILKATHRAMARALSALNPLPDHALVDGRPVPGLPCPSTPLVKGDRRSLSIAAASVVAKVTRDRIMLELAETYPEYGFAQHKGYGTASHLAALRKHGPTPVHRRSFRPVREACTQLHLF